MPVLKSPQDSEDDEPRLSILADIEKSATARLDQYVDISTKLTEPLLQSGVLTGIVEANKTAMDAMEKFSSIVTIPDVTASVRAINDLAASPVFTHATEALEATRYINDQITTINTDFIERLPDLSRIAQVITEPMERLQETASVLSRVHDFDTSISAITEAYDAVSVQPWMPQTDDYIIRRPQHLQITSAIAVLQERLDNFSDEISEKVEVKFQEQIDILIEKSIIPAGIKKAECRCSKCDKLLFKVEDMSHFMKGTLKCNCGETLQIPRDLKIVPL